MRDHIGHIGVVLVFMAYPGIYSVLVNSPVGGIASLVLPPMNIMVGVLYFALFAMSFDFISGYTGYLSLGHAAFYGTGGYLVILIANGKVPFVPPGTPFMASLVIAGALAVVLALVIGSVSFRLKGVYFAMITLGFSQVLYSFVRQWDYLVRAGRNPQFGVSVASGVEGFQIGIPFVDVVNLQFGQTDMVSIGRIYGEEFTDVFHLDAIIGFAINFGPTETSYYVIGAVVLICYLVMQRIIHSPFGQVMVAIRENEERAQALGYNVYWYKMGAFAISAFFAAIAGGLFAGFNRSVSPDSFFFLTTAEAILAAVIGGFGTLAGSFFGSWLEAAIQTFLSVAGGRGIIPEILAGHQVLFFGIIFIALLLYLPNGILGVVRSFMGGKVSKKIGEKVAPYIPGLR